MKRLSKEYCLNINENIDVKYGSVNRVNPEVIYVICKSWICSDEQIDYNEAINEIFYKFRKKLEKTIICSEYFENRFIFDFDINAASIRENKKKYLSIEFFVRQKNDVIKLNKIENVIEKTFKTIINNLVEDLEFHTFSVTKGK